MSKKAIITGATGGLGRNLGEYLAQQGWNVLGFGRNETIGRQLGYSFKSFDLSDPKECQKNFESADVVFHCAALSSPWGRYEEFYRHNVEATKNVIDMMKQYDIKKLVHVSTPSIYFDFTDQINVQENTRAEKFVNHYAKTKYMAEEVVLSSSVEATIIRPRGIFGEYDTVLVPRLEKIAQKGFLPLVKNRDAFIDVTYVGNVIHAMYLSATKDIPDKQIFNITNDESMHISKLYRIVMEALSQEVRYKKINYHVLMSLASALEVGSKFISKKEPMITKYGVGLISFDQTLDISKAKDILGYKPIYTIEEGMQRYAKSRNKTL